MKSLPRPERLPHKINSLDPSQEKPVALPGVGAPAYGHGGMVVIDRLRTWLIGGAIRRQMLKKKPLAMLDIGCGYDATQLRSNYANLSEGWGIDLNVEERCKAMPKLHFLEGNIENMLPDVSAQRFDVVLLISVLEHLWDPLTTLTHCHRVLKPEGVLFINVPTWAAKPVLEFSAFRLGTSTASSIDDHKTYYSKRDLWPLLIRSGFLPSRVRLHYQFLGMTLFAVARRHHLG